MGKGGGVKQISQPSSVYLAPHVWLGNGSRVSKGVSIGEGTILGQMSLATGTLDEHSIYGGIPAKLIRKDIEWSRTSSYRDIPDEYLIDGATH